MWSVGAFVCMSFATSVFAQSSSGLESGNRIPDTLPQNSATFQILPSQGGQVTAKKPIVESVPSGVAGSTFVTLDPKLGHLMRGGEPQSLSELLALENQQKAVIEKATSVTVNVQQGSAQGSGVIINADGHVLTAAHVAGRPNRDAIVTLSNGRRLRAKTLGLNRDMDAGLIKIIESDGTPWEHATPGKSESLAIGQWVVALGHPGGWIAGRPPVVRVGRILENLKSTIVTDCALIGGDSGGPLFDLSGRLVGIHSRIGTDVADNMHVPVDVFAESWDRLARKDAWGALPGFRPVIGVNGHENSNAPVIASLRPNGPAESAGLEVGDRITEFDGIAIQTFADLKQAVGSSMPGDRVRVRFVRQGLEQALFLTVGILE